MVISVNKETFHCEECLTTHPSYYEALKCQLLGFPSRKYKLGQKIQFKFTDINNSFMTTGVVLHYELMLDSSDEKPQHRWRYYLQTELPNAPEIALVEDDNDNTRYLEIHSAGFASLLSKTVPIERRSTIRQ